MWLRVEYKGHVLWRVRKWHDWTWLKHGFSTRLSGGLVDLHNRTEFAEAFSFPLPWITAQQVHGNCVTHVQTPYLEQYNETDGMFTSEKDVVLATFYADCVPLLFVDPVKRVVGTAHAGWRGTQKQIGVNMVRSLMEVFHCNPHQIEVGIGPSIGPCCYTVSQDVAEFFPDSVIPALETSKYQLDLWHENFIQLVSAGILSHNIHSAHVCTYCSQEFFSYRKEKTASRMAALIGVD